MVRGSHLRSCFAKFYCFMMFPECSWAPRQLPLYFTQVIRWLLSSLGSKWTSNCAPSPVILPQDWTVHTSRQVCLCSASPCPVWPFLSLHRWLSPLTLHNPELQTRNWPLPSCSHYTLCRFPVSSLSGRPYTPTRQEAHHTSLSSPGLYHGTWQRAGPW